MIYTSVKFRGKEGSLVASTHTLCFHGGNNSEEWLWTSFDKISINKPGPNCLLRISLVDENEKPLMLLFRERETLEAAKKYLDERLKSARGNLHSTSFEWDDKPDSFYGSARLGDSAYSSGWETNNTSFSFHTRRSIGIPVTNMQELNSMISMATHEEKEELIYLLQLRRPEQSINGSGLQFGAPSSTRDSNEYPIAESYKSSDADDAEMNLQENTPFGDLDPMLKQEESDRTSRTRQLKVSRRRSSALGSVVSHADWHAPLFGETTYTLMYLCEWNSQGFWYSIFIYGLQMASILLTLADISRNGVTGNTLDIPPMVDTTVTCAQAMALFMALAYQSDMIQASLALLYGFHPEVLNDYPGATFNSWLLACLAQLMAGMLLLIDCFILTMQASRVIDVMLNLTALLFMAEIDDVGFWLAKAGFISSDLQRQALGVVGFHVPKRKVQKTFRRILFFLALVGLFVGYGVLKSRQLGGDYLETYLYVQFGGEYNSKLPFFSGLLASSNTRQTVHREYRDLATGTILLAYCESERAWTFSEVDDPCVYLAKTQKTASYDVASIPMNSWQVLDSFNRLQPFESFSLVRRGCNPHSCQGDCVNSLCVCPANRFGIDCEFFDVCPELVIDERMEAFPPINSEYWDGYETVRGTHAMSTEFSLLRNNATGSFVRVYNMPVYYSSRTYPANIIFFAGRRWVFTTEQHLFNLTEARVGSPSRLFFPEKTVAVLEDAFHGYHRATFAPLVFSDPVDYHTPAFLPTPAGLRWWTVATVNETLRQYARDSALDTVLYCKSCLAEHGGYCDASGGSCNQMTGQCDCFNSWRYGHRCELELPCYAYDQPCLGDGVCDEVSGKCRCELPWHGKNCELRYQCYEARGACQNGGVCDLSTGWCDCSGDPATEGWMCEQSLDCHIYGCENGGYCGVSGVCECHPPFYGVLCNQLNTSLDGFFCSRDQDCVNGKCITEDSGIGICKCDDPRSLGTLCEHQYNCTSSGNYKCPNFGTCNYTSGLCDCPDPYYGPDCSMYPRCSNDTDCGVNGYCWGGECSCYSLDTLQLGKRCEVDSSDCYGCFDRGRCRNSLFEDAYPPGGCECFTPSAGRYCNYVVADIVSKGSMF